MGGVVVGVLQARASRVWRVPRRDASAPRGAADAALRARFRARACGKRAGRTAHAGGREPSSRPIVAPQRPRRFIPLLHAPIWHLGVLPVPRRESAGGCGFGCGPHTRVRRGVPALAGRGGAGARGVARGLRCAPAVSAGAGSGALCAGTRDWARGCSHRGGLGCRRAQPRGRRRGSQEGGGVPLRVPRLLRSPLRALATKEGRVRPRGGCVRCAAVRAGAHCACARVAYRRRDGPLAPGVRFPRRRPRRPAAGRRRGRRRGGSYRQFVGCAVRARGRVRRRWGAPAAAGCAAHGPRRFCVPAGGARRRSARRHGAVARVLGRPARAAHQGGACARIFFEGRRGRTAAAGPACVQFLPRRQPRRGVRGHPPAARAGSARAGAAGPVPAQRSAAAGAATDPRCAAAARRRPRCCAASGRHAALRQVPRVGGQRCSVRVAGRGAARAGCAYHALAPAGAAVLALHAAGGGAGRGARVGGCVAAPVRLHRGRRAPAAGDAGRDGRRAGTHRRMGLATRVPRGRRCRTRRGALRLSCFSAHDDTTRSSGQRRRL